GAGRGHRQGGHAVPAGVLPRGDRWGQPGRERAHHPAQLRAGGPDRGRPRRAAVAGMTIVVVGDVVTDIHAVHSGPIAVGSDTPAAIRVLGGGSAANTAAWLAAAGARVELVAVVGRDRAGDDRIAELTAAGVGCVHIRRTDDARTGSIVVLAHGHERSFLTDRGANLLLVPSDGDPALVSSRHLHLSGYVLLDEASRPAGVHALAAARERGLSTSVDMASA